MGAFCHSLSGKGCASEARRTLILPGTDARLSQEQGQVEAQWLLTTLDTISSELRVDNQPPTHTADTQLRGGVGGRLTSAVKCDKVKPESFSGW